MVLTYVCLYACLSVLAPFWLKTIAIYFSLDFPFECIQTEKNGQEIMEKMR